MNEHIRPLTSYWPVFWSSWKFYKMFGKDCFCLQIVEYLTKSGLNKWKLIFLTKSWGGALLMLLNVSASLWSSWSFLHGHGVAGTAPRVISKAEYGRGEREVVGMSVSLSRKTKAFPQLSNRLFLKSVGWNSISPLCSGSWEWEWVREEGGWKWLRWVS